MLAKRLALLSAFSGGCLFSAALIGFWCVDAAKRSAATSQGVRDPANDTLGVPNAPSRPIPSQALADDHAQADDRPARERTEDSLRPSSDPNDAKATGPAADDKRSEPASDPGSSVADVLGHLESSYRQALAVAALSDTPSANGRGLTATSRAAESAPSEREPTPQPTTPITEPPAPKVSEASPPAAPPREDAVAALADNNAPPKNLRSAEPQSPALPAVAPPPPPRNEGPPPDAYAGDVRPNIYIGNVGNIYQGDVYQVQQLAVLQLLAPLAFAGLSAPANVSRGGATRRSTPFPSTLTNPDNPWGFNFHPPVLVK